MAVIGRKLQGDPQRTATRDNRHLVHRITPRNELGHECVPGLVIRGHPLLLFAQDHALPLGPHEDLILRHFEIVRLHFLLVLPGRPQRRFVDQIFEVRAGEPGRASRDLPQLNITGDRYFLRMDFENLGTPPDVGPVNHDLAIEPSRPQERRIKHVRSIGGGNQDHTFGGFKSIHLHEKRVQRLLTLIVAAAEPGPAKPAHRIDFINEDNAGRMLLTLFEQISDSRRAHADKHLHEVGPANVEERHARFPGDGLCQERLPCSGRSDNQHALWDSTAQLLKFPGIFQELDNLLDLFFRFIDTGHISERNLLPLLGQQPGAALSERERLVPTDLHLAHEEEPETEYQNEWAPSRQEGDVPRMLVWRPRVNLNVPLAQDFDEVRVFNRIRADTGPISQNRLDIVALNFNLGDLTLLQVSHEIAEDDLLFRSMGRDTEQIKQQDHEQCDNDPKQ